MTNPTMQFEHLDTQFARLVRAICSRSLRGHQEHVDDCCQAAWLKVWFALQAGRTVNKAYIALAAQHCAMDLRQKLNLHPEQSLDDMGDHEDEHGNSRIDSLPVIAGNIIHTAPGRSQLLRAAIDALSPVLRETVEAFYFQCLTSAQIARRHNIPVNTVTRRLTDARKALKAALTTTNLKAAA